MVHHELNGSFGFWFFVFSALIICAGCLFPAQWLPPIKNDKLAHFLAFAGLAILAKVNTNNASDLILWLCGIFFAGLAIEALQNLIPGRHFCWKDMAANLAGIIAASLMCTLFDYVQPFFL